jgi:hypothetical protein
MCDFHEYYFQKLPQLSQVINVLDAAASNIHGFLWRDTCVSSTQIGLFGANRPFLNLETPKLQEVFLS